MNYVFCTFPSVCNVMKISTTCKIQSLERIGFPFFNPYFQTSNSALRFSHIRIQFFIIDQPTLTSWINWWTEIGAAQTDLTGRLLCSAESFPHGFLNHNALDISVTEIHRNWPSQGGRLAENLQEWGLAREKEIAHILTTIRLFHNWCSPGYYENQQRHD